jgi:hypothetical protein
MCGFERALAIGLGGAAWARTGVAEATDPGRLELMAKEVAHFSAPLLTPANDPSWPMGVGVIAGVFLAAYLGTRFGVRRVTFGRVREKDGWREVTYRFRSAAPLQLRNDLFPRLEDVLEQLEDLGTRIRKASEKRLTAPTEPDGEPAPPIEGEASLTAKSEEPSIPPIRFARNPDREGAGGPDAAGESTGAEDLENNLLRSAARARSLDRRSAYGRARTLLAEGHAPDVVRELTGLRPAELELLRSVPQPAGSKS